VGDSYYKVNFTTAAISSSGSGQDKAMADFLQLVRPQTLDLMQYERVWWDPGHQHFVVLSNGVFSALSSSSVPGRGLTRRSRPVEAQGGSGAKLAKYSLDMELLALQVRS